MEATIFYDDHSLVRGMLDTHSLQRWSLIYTQNRWWAYVYVVVATVGKATHSRKSPLLTIASSPLLSRMTSDLESM